MSIVLCCLALSCLVFSCLVLSCVSLSIFPSVVEANEHDELPRQARDTHTHTHFQKENSRHFHA
eukprot:COSAG06_NODE_2440_length_6872_cov_135.458586_3_plen_64_part_00